MPGMIQRYRSPEPGITCSSSFAQLNADLANRVARFDGTCTDSTPGYGSGTEKRPMGTPVAVTHR